MKNKKLKRLITIALSLAIVTSVFVGCGSKESTENNNENASEQIFDAVTSVETVLKNAKLEGEMADTEGTVLTTMVSFTPAPAGHGNPSVNGGPDWSMEPLMYDYLSDYSPQPEKTFKPSLLESYDFNDKVLTLKLKEGLKWSDGSDLTADDLICNIFMEMTINKIAYYGESIKKIDDTTVEIKYNTDAKLVLDYILKNSLKYSKEEYGKFSERFQVEFENNRELDDNGNFKFTEEADVRVAEITSDFNNYLPELLNMKVSGAYVPTSMTSAEIIFERNPYYRVPLHIEKLKGIRPTSTESTALAISNKDYDFEGIGLSPDMALKVAENNTETIRQMVIPEFSSIGFTLNTQKYPTNDVNVRKALAYLIDREQIAPVSEPGMVKGDEYSVSLPPSIRDMYLSKDFLNTLENYDLNLDKATEYLEKAGWKKDGSKWVDAEGNNPEIIIAGVGEYPAYVVMGEAAANMLSEFGLNAKFLPKEAAAYNDYATSGDGHMVIDGYGSTTGTQHPYEAYDAIWWYGKRGINLKFPETGDLVFKNDETAEDFQYGAMQKQLFSASTEEEITSATEEFSKFFNDNVWYIAVTEKYYVTRIHNPKLSLTEAPTGEQLKDFYWSGTPNGILGKILRSGELYYIK